MLKKYKIYLAATILFAIGAVYYMYSKNYITFESGIYIGAPQEPDITYEEKPRQPANVEESVGENVSKVEGLSPSSETTKVEEHRFFDDVLKMTETLMPLLTVLIPLYLNKRNKKKAQPA